MPISLDGNLGIFSSGNIRTANYFVGNGRYITDVYAAGGVANSISSSNGNISFDANGNVLITANGVANVATVTSSGLSVTGDIAGSNLTTSGQVTATGNVVGSNLVTTGTVDAATANITGNALIGNVSTTALDAATATVTGNATVGNLIAAGEVTATGNVTGGNVVAVGNVSGTNLVASANVIASGNVSAGNLVTTGALIAPTANISDATIGNLVTGSISTNAIATTAITASGNITGGNIISNGVVAATGNVSGGNLTTSGTVSATTATITGNINSGNIITTAVDSATVTATGNVTGGNLTTAGAVTSATASVTGNATVGNLITAGVVDAAGASFTGNIAMNNYWVNSLSDPVQNQDAATKAYVDNRYVGINGVNIVSGATVANVSANVDNVSTSISAGGNIQVAPTYLSTYTGNISANNITSNASTVVGNLTAGNLTALYTTSTDNLVVSNAMSIGTTVFTANSIVPAEGTTYTVDANVVFLGNLQVQGNLTTVNSNVVTIDALVWEAANSATNSAQADGGGLAVGPSGNAYASLLYSSLSNVWNTNIGISANGNLRANGNVYGGNAIFTANVIANNAAFASNVSVGNLTVAGATAFNTISANLVTTANVATPLITVLGTNAGAGFFLPTIVYSGSSTNIDSARLTLHLQVGKPPTNVQIVDVMVAQDSAANVSYSVHGHVNTDPSSNNAIVTATTVGGLLKVIVDPNGLGTMYCTYEVTEFGSTV